MDVLRVEEEDLFQGPGRRVGLVVLLTRGLGHGVGVIEDLTQFGNHHVGGEQANTVVQL